VADALAAPEAQADEPAQRGVTGRPAAAIRSAILSDRPRLDGGPFTEGETAFEYTSLQSVHGRGDISGAGGRSVRRRRARHRDVAVTGAGPERATD